MPRHGLRADPAALRALAERTRQQSVWHDAERSRFAAAVARTGDELRAALRERGILDEGSPLEQFARYEAQAGGTSARRAELERALAARMAAEEAAADVVAARRDAVAQSALGGRRGRPGPVGRAGGAGGGAGRVARRPDGARRGRAGRAPAHGGRPVVERTSGPYTGTDHARFGTAEPGANGTDRPHLGAAGNGAEPARELAALLDGGSAADLRGREEALRAERDERLAAGLGRRPGRVRGPPAPRRARLRGGRRPGPRGRPVVRHRADRGGAGRDAAGPRSAGGAAGRPRPLPVDGPGVARADEEVEAAEAELRRIEQLRRTTALTRRFLARAQEQAHQDIAPVLAATLRELAPGRDPRPLRRRDRRPGDAGDPGLRVERPVAPADRLSAGTTDQVYLLLRVALAQHLATTGETCPLLLDGVTAQSDDERTREILDLLLRLAAERQVVLFTQEETVLRWAREHLGRRPPPRPRAHPPARRLIRLGVGSEGRGGAGFDATVRRPGQGVVDRREDLVPLRVGDRAGPRRRGTPGARRRRGRSRTRPPAAAPRRGRPAAPSGSARPCSRARAARRRRRAGRPATRRTPAATAAASTGPASAGRRGGPGGAGGRAVEVVLHRRGGRRQGRVGHRTLLIDRTPPGQARLGVVPGRVARGTSSE